MLSVHGKVGGIRERGAERGGQLTEADVNGNGDDEGGDG